MDENVRGGTQLLRENLESLAQILPTVAPRVTRCVCEGVARVSTRSGEENLEVDGVALHARYSAVKEAERWFASLDLEGVQVLYVYGVGLGYALEAAQAWLKGDPGRYLVFIEDDLRVLRMLMESERGRLILQHKQVQLHFLENLHLAEPMIAWITWYFVRCRVEIAALPTYSKARWETFDSLRRWLLHESVQQNSAVSEYMRHGASFFRNYYANILSLPGCYSGDALKGRFQNVPAIICGAGPSLNCVTPLLKELERRALILAGGSSVNALSAQGVSPHLGGGIDPNPPQLQRLHSNQAYELPYFTRGRMYHLAFRAIRGPRLHLSGSGGYAVSAYFEEKLGIPSYPVEEGHNVVNFLMDIARLLGCNPIILVGMDLAYSGLKAYADGVLADASVEEKDILETRDLDSGAFLRPDIHGQPVYTLWKWVNESRWVTHWVQDNPQLTVINATGGGIGFEGVVNRSLADVVQKELQRERDLKGRLHAEIQAAARPDLTDSRVEEVILRLRESVERCVILCDETLCEIDLLAQKQKKKGPRASAKPSSRAKELEEKLLAEEAFDCILSVFNDVYTKVQKRSLQQVKHDWRLKSDLERQLARLELSREKFTFLRDAAVTNLAVMDEVLVARREERCYGTLCS